MSEQEHRKSVILVNVLNGRRAEVVCFDDPDRSKTSYIEHCNLLDWSVKTGCSNAVRNMWNPNNEVKEAFIGFENDGLGYDLAIYRNPNNRDLVKMDEKLAFLAIQMTRVSPMEVKRKLGDRPNVIPRKGG